MRPARDLLTMNDTPTTDDGASARVDQYLHDVGLAARGATVVPLTGDASDRRYFRVLVSDEPSQVLAAHSGAIAFASLPFANVAQLFGAMPLPVPRILGHSDPLGIIALEDLGDVTLQAHLAVAPVSRRQALYQQAVDMIDTMQRRGRDLVSNEYLPYRLAFDADKLLWELRFFATHFLQAYCGITLASPTREALDSEFATIAEALAVEPRVLCHRDYHSRNLMFHRERLYVIDFQDARMGPDTYDLVSLLRDSYIDLTEAEVDGLIAHFLTLRSDRAEAVDPAGFRRRFDRMALQRNLKALGTFGFQASTSGNRAYVPYIPRTLGYIRTNLSGYPEFPRLRELLPPAEFP